MSDKVTGIVEATIELTTEATPQVAERAIRREIKRALRSHSVWDPKWVEPLTVTEGTEDCGYGPLHITGVVEHFLGHSPVTYRLDAANSEWRNFGFPSGTKYHIKINLVR